MSFVRTHQRHLKDGSVRTYYEEVESYREGGKVRQRRIRFLGISPVDPIPLPPAQMALLATQLATGSCTAEDVFRFIQGMGVELPLTSLKALDIRYDLGKKRSELRLYPTMPSDHLRSRAGKRRTSPRPTRPESSRLKERAP